jgi:ribonuclease P protein component
MKTFKKEERLYNKKVIDQLFSKGSRFFEHPFMVVWLKVQHQSDFPAMIMINVSKRNVRKAVVRNRIKRQVREIYRNNKQEFYDFLESRKEQCVFALIYTASQVLSFNDQEKKILLILQRLQKQHEKLTEPGHDIAN